MAVRETVMFCIVVLKKDYEIVAVSFSKSQAGSFIFLIFSPFPSFFIICHSFLPFSTTSPAVSAAGAARIDPGGWIFHGPGRSDASDAPGDLNRCEALSFHWRPGLE